MDVAVDGVPAQDEPGSDLLVAQALRHKAENFYLAPGQACQIGCLAGPGLYFTQHGDCGLGVRGRSEHLEDGKRCASLRFGNLGILFTQGLREQQACAGCLEAHVEPDEISQRRVEVPLCRGVRGSRKSSPLQALASRQHDLAIESAAHLGERVASPGGPFDLGLADLGLTKQLQQ